ncbi:MAG: Hsp70 family protein, partial [Candidatus Riflebacteria bacterium]|nr:Hsp70 family protein [Candidatus Riflebacteria bacterium]
MKNYIGIDLGTTNSSIAIYDGENIRICKSPEQNDVTPSAIVIDKRGNKFVGKRAYDISPISPDNSALLFKRLMGSNTKIKFTSINEEKTPEECSAEILKILFGYIPEEIRNSHDYGTVITIPAAFNQMQKDATVKAANMAGIGKVALMQEPVAAIMSIMRFNKKDGIFLIYDLGGGTLDIAIAENNSGRINLLANGGIQMCGGRDIDRSIYDNIVFPWLNKNFKLPSDFNTNKKYKKLIRLAYWAIERTKIELSSNDTANIVLNEMETNVSDESDEEIYLDIPLTRSDIEPFINERVKESIEAIKETLSKASLSTKDIDKIVFIGGPTNYKPLRDKVCQELGIEGNIDVNPMTAVAEGAAIFAESIDWDSVENSQKSSKSRVSSDYGSLQLTFVYTSRTPDFKAKVKAQIKGNIPDNCQFQIDSLDTDWSSGKQNLINGATLTLNLPKNGDNTFKIFTFNPAGQIVNIPNNIIVITRTSATVDAITASHSIGIAVKARNSFTTELEWLIRAGDNLPYKGSMKFKATETLKAGSRNSLNFKLFEGEIQDPVTDNRDIGTLKIRGTDIKGVIAAGDELICDYEMLDSGNIILHVSVPSIGETIDSMKNFYSP